MPDEIERIHKEVLEFERIEAISDPMRELIEELWPELVHQAAAKEIAGLAGTVCFNKFVRGLKPQK